MMQQIISWSFQSKNANAEYHTDYKSWFKNYTTHIWYHLDDSSNDNILSLLF